MKKISIVILCYNDETALMKTYKDINNAMKKMPISYEFIFIDNGSRDASLSILRRLAEEDYNCNYISLTKRIRNHEAIFLGAKQSTGNYIGFLDCYHPGNLIPTFYAALQQKQCPIVGGEAIQDHVKKGGEYQAHFKMICTSMFEEMITMEHMNEFYDRFYNTKNILWIPYKELEHIESPWEDKFITMQKYAYNTTLLLCFCLLLCLVILPVLFIGVYHMNPILSYIVAIAFFIILYILYYSYNRKVHHKKINIKESTF